VTFVAGVPQFLFVNVVFDMTGGAVLWERFEFTLDVAFLAGRVDMLAVEFEARVFRGVVLEEGGFESGRVVAGFAGLFLELSLVNILMAIRAVAGGERDARQLVLDVAFVAADLPVFVGQWIFCLVVIDFDLFPALRDVAFGAIGFAAAVGVLVTGGAPVKLLDPVVVFHVAFFALRLKMLAGQAVF